MAKVWRFKKLGGPDVLRMDDVSLPDLNEQDVHIQVKAIGLNRSDLNFRMNQYIQKPVFPSRFGSEASGIILEVGSNVEGFRAGDEVFIIPPDNLSTQGTAADELVLHEKFIVKKPPSISFEEASAVWMQYLTAWGGVIHCASPKKGDFVLITAGSSSVGIAAMQLIKQIGAIPILTTLGREKKKALLMEGAEFVIATDCEDLSLSLSAITGKDGLAAAFDAVGGPQVLIIADALKKYGRLVIHGMLSEEDTHFPVKTAIRKSLSFHGYLFSEIINNPILKNQAIEHILSGITNGELIPKIDKLFSFEQMREAQEYMSTNHHIGKVVIKI